MLYGVLLFCVVDNEKMGVRMQRPAPQSGDGPLQVLQDDTVASLHTWNVLETSRTSCIAPDIYLSVTKMIVSKSNSNDG